ncbi:MAG TPA: archaeal heat shock protein Hsp20 [Nitrososphaeraceae archaeon]|nr:archaeal heat shock protein Hsp20 [Nitrososphaeraceae archaeon]
MSFPNDIDPYNFFRQFFGGSGGRKRGGFFGSGGWNFDDMFREFDETRKDMERTFSEQFKNIENKVPKDLVREYETPEGGKVREVGPIVYGYSMTIGPDGKPKIREFGNVKSPFAGRGFFEQPSLSVEREPLIDISSTDKEVKIVAEMPGISKEKIRIDAYDNSVEIKSEDPKRKYHKTIEVPENIDIESARSNYNNGILEITFKKKEQQKPKGRQINIE